MRFWNLLLITALSVSVRAQAQMHQYDDSGYGQDYANDNLYHDYVSKQQEKAMSPTGNNWIKYLVAVLFGWVVGGKIHSKRHEKKVNAKHKEEQKALYTQYYNDVYTLQQQNLELTTALEQLGIRVR